MNKDQKEILRTTVAGFLKQQHDYQNHNEIPVFISFENGQWGIIVGDDRKHRIAGFGRTPETALSDFLLKWKCFNGFAFLKMAKSI